MAYLDNQVIARVKGFNFEIVSSGDEWGSYEYQAVISNDQKLWSRKVGFKTESYFEACQELKYYMDYGFKFGKVEFNPVGKVVAVS